jgi:hypothetical protein
MARRQYEKKAGAAKLPGLFSSFFFLPSSFFLLT